MTFRPLAVSVVLFVAVAALAQTSVSIAYDYAPITFPGARVTNAVGINNSNVIVGSYLDSQDMQHGFVYSGGKYTSLNFPGATATQALGINDNGDIVGMYQFAGNLNFHGFLKHGSDFTSIDDPSAQIGTIAFGINKNGTIVGSYDNAHGFVYQNGNFSTLDAPQLSGESHQTQLNGISALGSIVGQVFTGGIWRAFWIENGKLRYVEPAGSTDSEATGINSETDIVGCHDSAAGFASFLAGNYPSSAATFPPEQPVVSCASGINFARAIVGSYSSLSNSNGFLGVPALTLTVTSPTTNSFSSNSVRVTANASGNNPVAHIQVWLNFKQIYSAKGGSLDTNLTLPAGSNQRFVVQAVDTKGVVAKVVKMITVQ
jgi:uncharacterized membrane protein